MKLEILRVVSLGAKMPAREPRIMAVAGGQLVKWSVRDGWTCRCDAPQDAWCDHVDAIDDLLHASVLEEREDA